MGGDGDYWTRVRRIFYMMDIRNAFLSVETISDAAAVVRAHKKAGGAAATPATPEAAARLQRAQRIVDATVHPDSGDIISPALLRISCMVPMNLTMDTLMISARGVPAIIGAQWANQTYNALHYYANRNATNYDTSIQRWAAYTFATASSVGAALGVTKYGENLARRAAAQSGALHTMTPFKRMLYTHGPVVARRGAPLAAVAAADVLNVFTMRCSEYWKGVNIYADGHLSENIEDRKPLATSRLAAPILSLPPAVMHFVENKPFFQSRPWARFGLLMLLIASCIQVATPFTFGLFRQTARVHVRWLEPQFRNLTDEDGNPVTYIRYNKGL